ncbi:NIPSNAP family protein [Foetidibacter luteolus]|uniref:NIPSNAP family protein n=1 Tax=Foetidibacter luteolus TaxID=2608880 RepID=UPI00129A2751|nr:NIPSNAP family protein [Foetidibacter luteolus]
MLITVCLLFQLTALGKESKKYYYQLKIYHLASEQQEQLTEQYLEKAYLPALHRAGIPHVGVFKPIKKDSAERLVYVFIPFSSLEEFDQLEEKLEVDKQYLEDGKDYIAAPHNNAPYRRIESILTRAFSGMPQPAVPALTVAKKDRVYEMRSYEGPTEKYYKGKVKMFNTGDEVGLFKRLGFNAVFYAEVISGSHMPNLMYMTTFNNMEQRDQLWKAFFEDAQWKKLVADEQYKNTVSKSDIFFLYPAEYSDY